MLVPKLLERADRCEETVTCEARVLDKRFGEVEDDLFPDTDDEEEEF